MATFKIKVENNNVITVSDRGFSVDIKNAAIMQTSAEIPVSFFHGLYELTTKVNFDSDLSELDGTTITANQNQSRVRVEKGGQYLDIDLSDFDKTNGNMPFNMANRIIESFKK